MKKILLLLLILLIPIGFARVIVTPDWPTTGTAISVINLSSEQITAIPIEYDPAPAQPGQYVTFFIKLENPTQSAIQDSMFKLEPGFPFSLKPGDSDTKSFGRIAGGQQILLVYNLFVDERAKEDDYVMYLRSCTNSECTSGLKTPIEIAVRTGGEPKVEVGIEDTDVLYSGATGTATLHVINRGLLDTKFGVVQLLPSDNYEILSPTRIYIGELESDDFETAEFDLYINGEDETHEIPLEIFVEYTDENDKDYSETQTIMLKVYSQKDLAKFGLRDQGSRAGLFVAFLIILGLGGYYYYKKKMKKNV